MSLDDDLKALLSDTQRFLRQQAELYGDSLLVSRAAVETPKEEQIIEKEKPISTDKNLTMLREPEIDMFGDTKKVNKNKFNLDYPAESWTSAASIPLLNQAINTCTKCGLSGTRTNFVFGAGNPKAEVVVVGEAPGAEEDAQGEPFVGRGGQLLTKILESIHFKREEVFICNILKCRPPNNRDPQPEEVELCEPYLWKQLELINPKIILCVGRIAGQSLLKINASLAVMRTKVHDYRGIPLMVTFHPAALLRNPNWKRPCWEDVQKFRKLYEEIKGKNLNPNYKSQY
ncbi:MAG: uracil-DNA glycosylase [Bacteroidetes bacterium]|nr:uracil-DNA glycosylase [Bacteroidota bacterium]